MIPCDQIGQELEVGDYVVSYNHLYIITTMGKATFSNYNPFPVSTVKMKLAQPSKTSKQKMEQSSALIKIPADKVQKLLDRRVEIADQHDKNIAMWYEKQKQRDALKQRQEALKTLGSGI